MRIDRKLTIEVLFVICPIIVGMSVVRWVSENFNRLGMFSFFIAMTPLSLLIEYSIFVPSYIFIPAVILSMIVHDHFYKIRSKEKIRCITMAVYSIGVILIFSSVVIFISSCLVFNVGQGPAPKGWVMWAKISSVIGEIGFLTVVTHWIMSRFAPSRRRRHN